LISQFAISKLASIIHVILSEAKNLAVYGKILRKLRMTLCGQSALVVNNRVR
jgi:hypothetical protein